MQYSPAPPLSPQQLALSSRYMPVFINGLMIITSGARHTDSINRTAGHDCHLKQFSTYTQRITKNVLTRRYRRIENFSRKMTERDNLRDQV